ncbi:helix-turn-helix transcriptional regulator [Paenibacillus tundrae]|uniref:YesN/AraC family two-component response regulator n=1 Tax=Paenibacillus tundrae TaxID=528187 RepID=A0ABT9WJC8_9BACL|nr:helix-turn-helix transcriptional regulator [Paenibacillus tundrae]MDQ0173394.1 YesN/AraC family two-component response regulator [Paenibacillus tundrae]
MEKAEEDWDIAEAFKLYVKQHYMHEISLQDMTGQMHFSVDYLKNKTGVYPSEYRQQCTERKKALSLDHESHGDLS